MTNAATRCVVLLAPPPVPVSDARRTRQEGEAGEVLADLFAGSDTHAALHQLLGEARGRGVGALLLVDAPEPAVRCLPWELLGAGGPLEARGEAIVARLVTGPAPRQLPTGDIPTVLLASPSPEDALVQTRLAALRAALERKGIPHAPADAAVDGSVVLHIVAHGHVEEAEAQILSDTGSRSAGTFAHMLAHRLGQASLVILDVCDAGSLTTVEAHAPGATLVRAGAAAVVAPSTRLGLEAAEAFSEGLYDALLEGESIAGAVAEGRRAVRALGRPHPDSRWANPVLHVGAAEAATRKIVHRRWRPETWTTRGSEISALLDRARGLGEPHGFVGLEHVLAAWPDTGGGPLAAHVRFVLSYQPDPIQRLGALRPRPDHEGPLGATPRLLEFAAASTDLESLAATLWNALGGAVQALLGLDEGQAGTFDDSATIDPNAPLLRGEVAATGLEVLGGPEDGRQFGPGDIIGRASLDTPGLYATTRLVDPYLSRTALIWGEQPELLKPARRWSEGAWVPVGPGPLELSQGDRLALTPATLLRAT